MDIRVLTPIQIAERKLSTGDLLRKRIKVNEEGIEDIIFKIAETKEELESAFRLTYEIYVRNGYMDSSSTGLRFNFYNAMPYTQTFIAKKGSEVIMTMTLFPDSPLGLPADSIFQNKINEYRQQGRYISELGAHVSTLNNQKAVLHLIKVMFTYAYDYLKLDDFIITVPPKHQNFYIHVLGFEIIGEQTQYAYVNSNPAVALKLDLRKLKKIYWDNYPREPLENDIHHFFFIKNSPIVVLPERKAPLKVWNTKLFNYFFVEKTDLFFKTDDRTKTLMQNYYCANVMA